MDVNGSLGRKRAADLARLGFILVALAAVYAAPARADDDDDDNPSWTDKIGSSIKGAMTSAGKAVGLNKPTPPPVPESPSGCPAIAVLDGTQAQRVMAAGATGNEGLRYQYSISSVGRQCSLAGNRMAIQVGADGRVLLGPAGSAGHFDVPIRIVVFSDVDQKPVQSKLYKVSASIPTGQSAAPFQFVSDNFVVPIAAGRSAGDYSIKVGLDGAKGGGEVGSTKVHHHRHKATESAASQ